MTIQSNHKQEAGDCGKEFWLLIIAFGLMSVLPTNVQAQVDGVKNGDRVKIFAPTVNERPIKGTVIEISTSVLAIKTKNSTFYIPHSAVKRLAVSKGMKRHAGKGALIGAISGGLILGSTSAAINAKPAPDSCEFMCEGSMVSNSGAFAIGAVLGMLGGGAVGTLIGAKIRTDQWERVPVNVSVGMQPLPKTHGFGINPFLSLRFPIGKR